MRERLDSILGKDGFIALPSAPGPAPLKACAAEDLEEFRNKALALTCLAGLGGYPQVCTVAVSLFLLCILCSTCRTVIEFEAQPRLDACWPRPDG